eukprot:jgi/Hompol1/2740/HPOL_000629-RA
MAHTIEIPIRRGVGSSSGNEVLEVGLNDLTGNHENIIKILNEVEAPLSFFLEFALQYSNRDMIVESEEILFSAYERKTLIENEQGVFILILNALASRTIEKAKAETNPQVVEMLWSRATGFLNEAEQLDNMNIATMVAKGTLMLARQQFDQATYPFRSAIQRDHSCIPAYIGLASTLFHKQDYKAALDAYQTVLKLAPDIKPDVRIPIGICFHRLGMEAEARLAFSQVLSRKALYFAQAAIRFSSNPQLRAEAISAKARIVQALGNFDDALALFTEANDLNADSLLTQFGLAQMYLYKKTPEKAIAPLEHVLSKEPNNYEALTIAATAYSQLPEHATKAAETFDKLKKTLAIDDPNSKDSELSDAEKTVKADALLDLSLFYEKWNLKLAQTCKSTCTFISTEAQSVAPELLNNLAAMQHIEAMHAQALSGPDKLADTSKIQQMLLEADENYKMALNKIDELAKDQDSPVPRLQDIKTSIMYNRARLSESLGNIDLAKSQYLDILKEHPAYTDCLLRLGSIAVEARNMNEALKFFADVIAIDERNVTAWELIAKAHMSINKNLRPARKAYERITQIIDKYDMYALCSTGNMCLKFARTDPQQAKTHCMRAIEFFAKALRTNPRNVIAATGIAIAFAELGHLDEARNLFIQIQEIAGPNLNVALNLAHVLTELNNPNSAIPLYESVLKRTTTADLDVVRGLARAQYIIAKTTPQASLMAKVAKDLEQACEKNPRDLVLRFNWALAMQQYGQILNNGPKEERPLEALRIAAKGLAKSEEIFEDLAKREKTDKTEKLLGYDPDQAKSRGQYSTGVRRITEKKIHETEVFEKQNEQRLAEMAQRREEEERREREKREREEQEKIRQQEELDRKRLETRLQVQQDNEKMRIELEEEKARGNSKRSRANADNLDDKTDQDAEADGSGEEGRKPSKPKQKRKRKEKAAREEQDGESSDDDEAMQLKRSKNIGVKSKLSAAIIDSDDE